MDGPLLLTAGPGSGKTRVLLWRTVNLITFHGVSPSEIFLATFTEKAARQLKEGLQQYLGFVTNQTGKAYDLSDMAIGTVHAICQQLLTDRRFSRGGDRRVVPRLMDQLGQYFYLSRQVWKDLMEHGGFSISEEYGSYQAGHQFVNGYLDPKDNPPGSRHFAVQNIQRVFNRFSEEMIGDREVVESEAADDTMLRLYAHYRNGLKDKYAAKPTSRSCSLRCSPYSLRTRVPAKYFVMLSLMSTRTRTPYRSNCTFCLPRGTKISVS